MNSAVARGPEVGKKWLKKHLKQERIAFKKVRWGELHCWLLVFYITFLCVNVKKQKSLKYLI